MTDPRDSTTLAVGSARTAPDWGRAPAPWVLVVALLGGLLWSGCQDERVAGSQALLVRSARFGIFRDLVLIERPAQAGGPFFIDRFESTRGDWASFEAAVGRSPGAPDLVFDSATREQPMSGVTLGRARQFANWRFCRLPRRDEWTYTSTRGGSMQYPWGRLWRETWANTHGLKLGRVAPVGSFESGRSAEGPYDLIGNVAEWSESLALPSREVQVLDTSLIRPRRVLGVASWLPDWSPLPTEWLSMGDGLLSPDKAEERMFRIVVESAELPGVFGARQVAGLSCWLPDWSPRPVEWLVLGEHQELERQVLGGHFRTSVGTGSRWPSFPLAEPWLPDRYGDTTGVRLVAGPGDLLRRLVDSGIEPSAAQRRLLRRFLAVPDHRRVLRIAWVWLVASERLASQRSTPIYSLLQAALY